MLLWTLKLSGQHINKKIYIKADGDNSHGEKESRGGDMANK